MSLSDEMEQRWRVYLKKYCEIYKVRKAGDGCWTIACLEGNFIGIFSLTEKLLLFSFSSGKSARAKNVLKKKLSIIGHWHHIIQEGDTELIFSFKEADLPRFEKVLKIRRKKRFTPEYRASLVERAKSMGAMKTASTS